MWPLLAILAVLLVMGVSSTAMAYVRGAATPIELAPIGNGQSLRKDAAAAYLRMSSQATRDGLTLVPTSGFRTMEKQQELYAAFRAGTGNLAAAPGFSNHQAGIDVDIEVGRSFTSKTYLWLDRNAGQHGFVNTGQTFSQPEPWHWEYRA